jgi:hypothetical protein
MMGACDSYIKMAQGQRNISFLGRLGTYRYLDMDVTIKEALDACDVIDRAFQNPEFSLPTFLSIPIERHERQAAVFAESRIKRVLIQIFMRFLVM